MFSDALRINYTGRRRIKNHNIILRYALTRHPRPRVTGTAARRFRTRRARAPDTHVPANDKRVTPFVGRLCPEYLYQARWLKLHLHDEPRASSREISTPDTSRGTLNPIVPKNSVYPPRPGRGLEEIKIEDAWSGTNARRVAPGVGFFRSNKGWIRQVIRQSRYPMTTARRLFLLRPPEGRRFSRSFVVRRPLFGKSGIPTFTGSSLIVTGFGNNDIQIKLLMKSLRFGEWKLVSLIHLTA